MALSIKKGTAPATGKVKPSRQEQLLAQQAELARDQIPEGFTMEAITGGPPASAPANVPASGTGVGTGPNVSAETADVATVPNQAPNTPAAAPAVGRHQTLQELPLSDIQRSPFQPKGRPSATAIASIERALSDVGSLATLMSQEGAVAFNQLDVEAKRLAELAYDIQQRGVTDPIEVRATPEGVIECLRGHRRMAGARLARLTHIPVLHRGAMSNAQAAATVLSGNLHRENFTTWQEAVLVTQVQEQRRANNQPHDVRSLGAVMGWSHGKVQNLLAMRRALNPDYLREIGRGQGDVVEEMLSRMSVADLGRVAALPNPEQRTAELHRRLGWTADTLPASREKTPVAHRPKRGGGFELVVAVPIEALTRGDAAVLLEFLETQMARVRSRVQALDRIS